MYTYTAGASSDPEKSVAQSPQPALDLPSASVNQETGAKTSPLVRRSSVPATVGTSSSSAWNQPTCPICLDDFEANQTTVRELPCRHIFHPDCIDQFLLCNSSLCPMCKQSVLPIGACPVNITNVMVRRERHINQMRARAGQAHPNADGSSPQVVSASPAGRVFGSLGSRFGGSMGGRRIFSAPVRTQTRPSDIEMAEGRAATQAPAPAPHPPANAAETPSAAPINPQDCSPTHNRREWARQRALQLLGNRNVPSDADDEETGPRWRRTLRKAFPGFR